MKKILSIIAMLAICFSGLNSYALDTGDLNVRGKIDISKGKVFGAGVRTDDFHLWRNSNSLTTYITEDGEVVFRPDVAANCVMYFGDREVGAVNVGNYFGIDASIPAPATQGPRIFTNGYSAPLFFETGDLVCFQGSSLPDDTYEGRNIRIFRKAPAGEQWMRLFLDTSFNSNVESQSGLILQPGIGANVFLDPTGVGAGIDIGNGAGNVQFIHHGRIGATQRYVQLQLDTDGYYKVTRSNAAVLGMQFNFPVFNTTLTTTRIPYTTTGGLMTDSANLTTDGSNVWAAGLVLSDFINITSSRTTTSPFNITADSLTTGGLAYCSSNSADASGRYLFQIQNTNAAAIGTIPLYVHQSSANYAAYIDGSMKATSNIESTGWINSTDSMIFKTDIVASGHKQGITVAVSSVTSLNSAYLSFGCIFKELDSPTDQNGELWNGVKGQMITIKFSYKGGAGNYVLSCDKHIGFTSITFDTLGDSITLLFLDDTNGWIVIGNNGCTITT